MMTMRLVWDGVDEFDLAQDRGKVAHCCEHGKVPLGYIKYAKFLAWLRTHLRLKKDSIRWAFMTALKVDVTEDTKTRHKFSRLQNGPACCNRNALSDYPCTIVSC
jgi:hypothetical protein